MVALHDKFNMKDLNEILTKVTSSVQPSDFADQESAFETLFIECLHKKEISLLPQIIEYISLSNGDNFKLMLLKFLYTSYVSLFNGNSDQVLDKKDKINNITQKYIDILEESSYQDVLKAHLLCTFPLFSIILNDEISGIKMLTKYVQNNISNYQIWTILCNIYEKRQDWKNAIYCLEEVILHQPLNPYLHFKLGIFLENLSVEEISSYRSGNMADQQSNDNLCLKHFLLAYINNRKNPILNNEILKILISKVQIYMSKLSSSTPFASLQSRQKIIQCCKDDMKKLM